MRWFGVMLAMVVCGGPLAAPLPPVATAQEATPPAPTTLHLVEHAVHLTTVDHGEPGPSVGDVQVWGPNPLFDERDSADTGATTQGTCTALNAAFDCIVTETIVFANGSTLQIQGVEFAAAPSLRTIVGGSGDYLGATGTIVVEPTEDQSKWAKTIELFLVGNES
ncbi:MAG: dirigent protein [Caldilineaceae bacterium]|nr:dirigent protein [Caldilineaceae bacterium]